MIQKHLDRPPPRRLLWGTEDEWIPLERRTRLLRRLGAFGSDIDYAMLVKMYGAAPEGEKRYSPAVCTGARRTRIEGDPDPKYVST